MFGAIVKAQVSQGAVGNAQCLVLSESTSSQGAVGNALFCLDAGMQSNAGIQSNAGMQSNAGIQSNAGMQSSSWSVASMQ